MLRAEEVIEQSGPPADARPERRGAPRANVELASALRKMPRFPTPPRSGGLSGTERPRFGLKPASLVPL